MVSPKSRGCAASRLPLTTSVAPSVLIQECSVAPSGLHMMCRQNPGAASLRGCPLLLLLRNVLSPLWGSDKVLASSAASLVGPQHLRQKLRLLRSNHPPIRQRHDDSDYLATCIPFEADTAAHWLGNEFIRSGIRNKLNPFATRRLSK